MEWVSILTIMIIIITIIIMTLLATSLHSSSSLSNYNNDCTRCRVVLRSCPISWCRDHAPRLSSFFKCVPGPMYTDSLANEIRSPSCPTTKQKSTLTTLPGSGLVGSNHFKVSIVRLCLFRFLEFRNRRLLQSRCGGLIQSLLLSDRTH